MANIADGALFFDWDYHAGNFASLRAYLFEHHTIPLVNFYLCGGKPELANPQSYAFTWPSLFAYLFRPNVAVLTLALFMMACGAAFTGLLLYRWTRSVTAAATGACVYTFNGYFLSHFRVGHLTFSFCHLVPLLILLYDVTLEARIAGRPWRKPAAGLALASFAFFTAGLPIAFLYFYPALLLFGAFRLAEGWLAGRGRAVLRASLVPLAAHGMGLWLALYKFWPVVMYQLRFPRSGLFDESHTLAELAGNLVTPHPENHETDAVIGLTALAAGLVVALGALVRIGYPKQRSRERETWALAWYALALVAVGTLMSLGNANPAGPAFVLGRTLLKAVRFYSRYQILTVLGFALLCALAVRLAESAFAGRTARAASGLAVALAIGVPLGACALSEKPWVTPVIARDVLERQLGIAKKIAAPEYLERTVAADAFVIERGYWIPNCYEAIQVPYPKLDYGRESKLHPIGNPPPARLVELGASHVTLELAESPAGGPATLWLADYDIYVDVNGPVVHARRGFGVERALAGGRTVTLRYRFPDDATGLFLSLAGLAVLAALTVPWRRALARTPGK